MNELEKIRTRVAATGGIAWIEEVLIRGQPEGGVKGAHVIIGWKTPGIDGADVVGVNGPYPVTALAADPFFSALMTEFNLGMVAQVDTLTTAVQTLTSENQALQAQLAALEGSSGELVATL